MFIVCCMKCMKAKFLSLAWPIMLWLISFCFLLTAPHALAGAQSPISNQPSSEYLNREVVVLVRGTLFPLKMNIQQYMSAHKYQLAHWEKAGPGQWILRLTIQDQMTRQTHGFAFMFVDMKEGPVVTLARIVMDDHMELSPTEVAQYSFVVMGKIHVKAADAEAMKNESRSTDSSQNETSSSDASSNQDRANLPAPQHTLDAQSGIPRKEVEEDHLGFREPKSAAGAPPLSTNVPRGKPDTRLQVVGVTGANQYLARIKARIAGFWTAPPVDISGKALTTTVRFRLERDGRVGSVIIEKSSGNDYYDMAAQRAVQSAIPLPPFPPDLTDSYFDAYFTFAVGETSGAMDYPRKLYGQHRSSAESYAHVGGTELAILMKVKS